MRMEWRIKDEDMLRESDRPAVTVLNTITDDFFVKAIESVSNGIGFGVNMGACSFWEDLDEYERTYIPYFDGVLFGLHDDEETVLSFEEFYYYLKIVCEEYCDEYPEERAKVMELLETYRKRFHLTGNVTKEKK